MPQERDEIFVRAQIGSNGGKMELIIFLVSIYTFLETTITGYIEYKDNHNKITGIFLYILAFFCLIVPMFVV